MSFDAAMNLVVGCCYESCRDQMSSSQSGGGLISEHHGGNQLDEHRYLTAHADSAQNKAECDSRERKGSQLHAPIHRQLRISQSGVSK
eukprot:340162-Rhodomonas_salina.1